ncbi:MAG: chemotaxis protein CheX [Clostridia bacterium]|nr:chemotaxis protein CheX [Clostridia bacterium]
MKVDYINPFLTASQKIIKTVLRLDMALGTLSVKGSHDLNEIIVIIIGVKGDFAGKISFCIPHETACKIASIMMEKKVTRLDDISKSAVGELGNMILGRSGIIFANHGINVVISPPTIVQAKRLTISPTYKQIVNIPLNLSNNTSIDIEIEINDK